MCGHDMVGGGENGRGPESIGCKIEDRMGIDVLAVQAPCKLTPGSTLSARPGCPVIHCIGTTQRLVAFPHNNTNVTHWPNWHNSRHMESDAVLYDKQKSHNKLDQVNSHYLLFPFVHTIQALTDFKTQCY